MKLSQAIIGMTLLTMTAVSLMPTCFSGVSGRQKPTYRPTGSEGTITISPVRFPNES